MNTKKLSYDMAQLDDLQVDNACANENGINEVINEDEFYYK